MARHALAVGALVALTQSKAIVTNHCSKAVHLWSVPESGGYASHHKLEPKQKYEEFYHYGTNINPGVAIKISTHPNGIYEGKDEIDFAYTVDKFDPNKVWVSLDTLRSKPFDSNYAFFTCWGPYKAPFVPTRECTLKDNIELVLCGTERTEAAKDDSNDSVLRKCATALDDRNYEEHHKCNGVIKGPAPEPSQCSASKPCSPSTASPTPLPQTTKRPCCHLHTSTQTWTTTVYKPTTPIPVKEHLHTSTQTRTTTVYRPIPPLPVKEHLRTTTRTLTTTVSLSAHVVSATSFAHPNKSLSTTTAILPAKSSAKPTTRTSMTTVSLSVTVLPTKSSTKPTTSTSVTTVSLSAPTLPPNSHWWSTTSTATTSTVTASTVVGKPTSTPAARIKHQHHCPKGYTGYIRAGNGTVVHCPEFDYEEPTKTGGQNQTTSSVHKRNKTIAVTHTKPNEVEREVIAQRSQATPGPKSEDINAKFHLSSASAQVRDEQWRTKYTTTMWFSTPTGSARSVCKVDIDYGREAEIKCERKD